MNTLQNKPDSRYRVDIRREDVDRAIKLTGQPTGSAAVRMLLNKAFLYTETNTDVIEKNTQAVAELSQRLAKNDNTNYSRLADRVSSFIDWCSTNESGKEAADMSKQLLTTPADFVEVRKFNNGK